MFILVKSKCIYITFAGCKNTHSKQTKNTIKENKITWKNVSNVTWISRSEDKKKQADATQNRTYGLLAGRWPQHSGAMTQTKNPRNIGEASENTRMCCSARKATVRVWIFDCCRNSQSCGSLLDAIGQVFTRSAWPAVFVWSTCLFADIWVHNVTAAAIDARCLCCTKLPVPSLKFHTSKLFLSWAKLEFEGFLECFSSISGPVLSL